MDNTDSAGGALPWNIQAKLQQPPQARELVEREQLAAYLDRHISPSLRLILFSAPAGYGKTSSILQYFNSDKSNYRLAWLQLDSAEQQSKHFLAHIILSLAEANIDMAELELAAKQGTLDAPDDVVAAALMSKLDAAVCQDEPVLLVLDDYQFVHSEKINHCVQLLLELAADKLCLLIASRYRPDLKLSKLRLQGQLLEVGDELLQFNSAEAQSLLGESIAPDLQELVLEKSQGWVAMLQLAKIWGQPSLLRHFNGAREELAEYLAEQVVADQSDAERQFLLDTAVLDRVNIELADYIRASNDSHYYFRRLKRLSPLVVSNEFDDQLTYHPLLRDYLRERFHYQDPKGWHTKCCRAAEWYSNHDDLLNAVRLFGQAGNYDQAYRCFKGVGGWKILTVYGHQFMSQLLSMFPSSWLQQHADLVLFRVYLTIKEGDLAAAEDLFHKVLRQQGIALDELKSMPIESDWGMAFLILSIYLDKELDYDLLQQISAALDSVSPEDTAIEAVLLTSKFLCLFYLGQITESIAIAKSAIRTLQALELPYAQDYFFFHLSISQMWTLELDEARANIEHSIEFSQNNFGSLGNLTATGQVLLAQSYYYSNDLELTEELLSQSISTVAYGDSWYEILSPALACAMLSAYAKGKQDLQAAEKYWQLGKDVAKQRNLHRLDLGLDIVYSELLCRSGEFVLAEELLDNLDVENLDKSFYWQVKASYCFCICRLNLCKGDTQLAKSALEKWQAFITTTGLSEPALISFQYSLWQAAIDYQESKGKASRDQLCQQLNTRWVQCLSRFNWRFVVDMGNHIEPLLQNCLRLAKDDMLSSRYCQLIKQSCDAIGRQRDNSGLFSDRELEVLRSLADGNVNKQIARQLDMTENTVKYHLKRIYKKLGVDKRLAAVNEARRLNLL
ncbi:MAG: LuxR C-terminal-related transcriptional regulator [Cellvibrionaceae bacterium]|nr:LuxR C-terminal-related transcriptional regulator [Cellvibrionaceae bacterium]